MDREAFFTAYVECALWASTGDDDEPLDSWAGPEDVAPKTLTDMREDCEGFLALIQEADKAAFDCICEKPGRAGHDFWLTREGHGAGFWDGDWPSHVSGTLTKWAKTFGSYSFWTDESGPAPLVRHH